MPYNYEVIKIIKGTAKEIHELENILKKENKSNKYKPQIQFDGRYECFNKLKL